MIEPLFRQSIIGGSLRGRGLDELVRTFGTDTA